MEVSERKWSGGGGYDCIDWQNIVSPSLNIAGREHVLLHVVLIPLLLSRGEPALQVPPVLRGLASSGEVPPSHHSHPPVVAGVELGPVLQAQVVRAGQILHVVHQAGGVKLSRHEGSAGVAPSEEAVPAPGPVVLRPCQQEAEAEDTLSASHL